MRNFQEIIFIWIWLYREIFKSALAYLKLKVAQTQIQKVFVGALHNSVPKKL